VASQPCSAPHRSGGGLRVRANGGKAQES